MFDPWVRKIPWRRAWQPTPAFLPGESHGQRGLGAAVHGAAESDMIEVTEDTLTHAYCQCLNVYFQVNIGVK